MLAETSISEVDPGRLGLGGVAARAGGLPSQERSSGTGSTFIRSEWRVSRWVARTWTTPLRS